MIDSHSKITALMISESLFSGNKSGSPAYLRANRVHPVLPRREDWTTGEREGLCRISIHSSESAKEASPRHTRLSTLPKCCKGMVPLQEHNLFRKVAN